ncbi:MAG: vanadium-dependent haloperoxidase [Pseudomonadota bacterium]
MSFETRSDKATKTAKSPKDRESDAQQKPAFSRRALLKSGGALATLAGGAALASPTIAHAKDGPLFDAIAVRKRRLEAARLRRQAANAYLVGKLSPQESNGDDSLYPDRRASFFKTLPQNDLGEVDPAAYDDFLTALDTGRPSDFDAIPLSPQAVRTLANPQGAYAFEMTGLDGQATRMPPAPTFAGATQAAEMGEVYWQALTRDVPFVDYGISASIADAVADLNNFSHTVGPKDNGLVTPSTIFRGETPGDLVGPYISQLLWLDVPYGPTNIVQRYDPPVAGDDFMTDYTEWLAIQRGAAPSDGITFSGVPSYISNNRALGEYVRQDFVFQAYFNACLILLGLGADALAPSNPYLDIDNQGPFVTFGAPAIADLVTKAARVSLTGAWYQKWLVHRRLRPEVFAARVENQANGTKDYGINLEILNSAATANLFAANGNSLLPLAFPEGSPTHPAYPAGHATIAGACCTILKAFFDEDFVFPAPVQANADGSALVPWIGSDLTLGNEIDKLANNISIGRDAAGVHYRSDGVDGLGVGEEQALGMLQDYSRTYNENFDGFTLTRFDGTTVVIRDGKIIQ